MPHPPPPVLDTASARRRRLRRRRHAAATLCLATAATVAAVAAACGGRDTSRSRATGGASAGAAASSASTAASSATTPLAPSEPTTPIALPRGMWRTLASDGHTVLSVDTSAIVALPAGEARVRLLYAFDALQPVPRQPGLFYRTIASEEETDCAHATSHPSVAILYDGAGRELTRATTPVTGPRPPGLIGGLAPALCAYLRKR